MAKEEETEPGYIDYSGASTSANSWTGTDLLNYLDLQLQKRGIYTKMAPGASIKDRTNAKRMVEQYDVDTLKRMVDYFAKTVGLNQATFNTLYFNRVTIQVQSAPKDYDEWN